MTDSSRRILVVGGGVIGAACSHALARRGYQVTVIDKRGWGSACSHGNCGLICPSHVLPLTEPGTVRKTIVSLLKGNSPFSIRPRFDPRLWNWLWRFFRRCRHDRMLEAARVRMPLLEKSLQAYGEMVEAGILDCEWQARGSLYIYRDQKQLDKFAATAGILEQEFNLFPEKSVRCNTNRATGKKNRAADKKNRARPISLTPLIEKPMEIGPFQEKSVGRKKKSASSVFSCRRPDCSCRPPDVSCRLSERSRIYLNTLGII